jgi:hypothetical protein
VREELDLVREALASLENAGDSRERTAAPEGAGVVWRRWAVAASLLAATLLAAWAWSSHRLSLRSQELQLVRGRLEQVDSERARLAGRLEALPGNGGAGGLLSADLLVSDLFPADMVLRGEPQEDRAAIVPREARRAVLLLNSRLPADASVTGLALRDAGGAEVWRSSEPVRRGEHGEYALLLPVTQLAAGLYTLELHGGDADSPQVLEVYRLRLG